MAGIRIKSSDPQPQDPALLELASELLENTPPSLLHRESSVVIRGGQMEVVTRIEPNIQAIKDLSDHLVALRKLTTTDSVRSRRRTRHRARKMGLKRMELRYALAYAEMAILGMITAS